MLKLTTTQRLLRNKGNSTTTPFQFVKRDHQQHFFSAPRAQGPKHSVRTATEVFLTSPRGRPEVAIALPIALAKGTRGPERAHHTQSHAPHESALRNASHRSLRPTYQSCFEEPGLCPAVFYTGLTRDNRHLAGSNGRVCGEADDLSPQSEAGCKAFWTWRAGAGGRKWLVIYSRFI